MNFRHRRHCGCPKQMPCHCQKPAKEVVHPVKQNVVHNCSEETVKHVHPSHTTVMKHHLVKNEHVYPHSTSVQNTFDEVDVNLGSFNTPPMGPGSGVGGAMNGKCAKGKNDYNHGNGVMGAQMGHHHHGHGPSNCHKPKPNMWW